MLSASRIYQNTASTYSAPVVASFLEQILSQTPQDTELYNILKTQIPDTPENREILTWGDPVPISFIYITAYTAEGNGPQIESSNKVALDIIREFNDRINNSRQNIDDLFTWSYADVAIEGGSYWRVLQTKDSPVGIDLARLDPISLTKIKDEVVGWECFLQNQPRGNTYYSKSAFYNAQRQRLYFSQGGTSGGAMEHPEQFLVNSNPVAVIIPNEPQVMCEFEFFPRPLISPVLPYLIYKKWILWYMRKYSERHWSPLRVGFVGDPKSMMPHDPKVMKEQRDDLLNALVYMKNFGAMVTAGYNRIEEMGKDTAKSSEIYTNYIGAIDEQTMFALCGSMGQRSASGNELATSRILEHGFLRHCLGLRGRYRRVLDNFYRNVLLPANGIKLHRDDLTIRFSPIQEEKAYDLVRAVVSARKEQLFQDVNEPRRVLNSIWEGINDVDAAMAKKLDDQFMELNKKPEPSPFGASVGGKPKSGN